MAPTPKILIVDDDAGILDALTLVLENAGYKVAVTTKGEETYKKVEIFKPELILLDVLMSGNDGRHICRRLKATPSTTTVPILMISAHPSAKKGVKECGADGFLAKPFESSELLKKIKQFIP